MGRFVQGEDRRQDFLLPASLDDYVSEDNPVQMVEAFIDELGRLPSKVIDRPWDIPVVPGHPHQRRLPSEPAISRLMIPAA